MNSLVKGELPGERWLVLKIKLKSHNQPWKYEKCERCLKWIWFPGDGQRKNNKLKIKNKIKSSCEHC